MPDLRKRRRRPELMDQPGLDARLHAHALAGLCRINAISRGTQAIWRVVAEVARAKGGSNSAATVDLLDLATGGGDLPVRLARRARRAGFQLRLAGCDKSNTAIDHAQTHARARGVEVNFFVHDVLGSPLPRGYDIVTCSLFLHHLDEADAVNLLRKMRAAAAERVVVDDLARCRRGWLAAWFGTRLLSRSHVVHTDGPLSVEGAFTINEVRKLTLAAGWSHTSIERHWPHRFVAIEKCT